jgi:uncharacterized protein YraI
MSEEPLLTPETDDETPQVFAVSRGENGLSFTRRDFLEVSGVAAAGLAVTGSLLGGLESAPEALAACTVRTSRSNLNMRCGPGTQYQRIGYFPKDKDVTVIGQAKASDGSEWWQVSLAGYSEAWVSKRYVTPSGTCSTVPTTKPGSCAGGGKTPTATPGSRTNPGREGEHVRPGQTGIYYSLNGKTYTLPCGSEIPAGAECTCNCVSVPAACDCDSHTFCACDAVCTCDTVESHYWYPN